MYHTKGPGNGIPAWYFHVLLLLGSTRSYSGQSSMRKRGIVQGGLGGGGERYKEGWGPDYGDLRRERCGSRQLTL
jgi:hypothetical protein